MQTIEAHSAAARTGMNRLAGDPAFLTALVAIRLRAFPAVPARRRFAPAPDGGVSPHAGVRLAALRGDAAPPARREIGPQRFLW
jgi:hypothetical protein